MKKLTIFCVLIIVAGAMSFAAMEDVDVYEYLYNASQTNSAQLDILQNMSEARLSGAGEFYAKALRKLVSEYRNITHVTERQAASDQAMLLASLLGAEKYTKAAPDLWLVVDGFTDPLVKAEAMIALGRMRAINYLPQVIRILESYNVAPTTDRLYGERVAFGAIIALEKYQDPSGYLPVFFASTGWYSDRIKNQAVKSLPFIAQDPSPYMMEVVKGSSYDYPTKFSALKTIESTKVDSKKKVGVAVAALNEGWRSATNDVHLRNVLADMRKMSITMIGNYKTDDEAIYPLLEKSYTSGYDDQEKIIAIRALAVQGTEESAKRLSGFLMELNAKRLAGNVRQEEEKMVREIIPAIGKTGRSSARASLVAVGASNWTPAVKALADNAIKQLNK